MLTLPLQVLCATPLQSFNPFHPACCFDPTPAPYVLRHSSLCKSFSQCLLLNICDPHSGTDASCSRLSHLGIWNALLISSPDLHNINGNQSGQTSMCVHFKSLLFAKFTSQLQPQYDLTSMEVLEQGARPGTQVGSAACTVRKIQANDKLTCCIVRSALPRCTSR